jgi:hypothetical protein
LHVLAALGSKERPLSELGAVDRVNELLGLAGS